MNTEYLALTWSTSRGADTYGYNICNLTRDSGLKRDGNKWQCNGGGYDMTGTVFAGYLEQVHQGRLMAIAHRAGSTYDLKVPGSYRVLDRAPPIIYGMTSRMCDGETVRVLLDGGCGIESMLEIAREIGLRVDRTSDRKGHTTGFYVFIGDAPKVEL